MSNIQVVPKEQLGDFVGHNLTPTPWFEMSQDRIDHFADVTEDHQFIHVDEEKASQTPFGGTVAHGFFTLSLLAMFQNQVNVLPEGTAMAVNYGLNKVRFLQPVRAGKRVRAHIKPMAFEEKSGNRVLGQYEISVEIEGEDKPALVAEALSLFYMQ